MGDTLAIYPESDSRFFYGFNTDVTIEFFGDQNGKITHSSSGNKRRGIYHEAKKIE